ncbi:MAG TPA: hypothetical protein VK011_06360 [Acidimicrobiia bacterium]|nr:hypothetical protein [Acidimicrobiia bacterium]
MSQLRRLAAAVLTLAVLFFVSAPVLAQQEEETTDTTVVEEGETTTPAEDETTETTATEGGASGAAPVPAVSIPDTTPEEGDVDWTYRYLIPTLLTLAAIVVIVTTVQYFLRVVRNRYKVVE